LPFPPSMERTPNTSLRLLRKLEDWRIDAQQAGCHRSLIGVCCVLCCAAAGGGQSLLAGNMTYSDVDLSRTDKVPSTTTTVTSLNQVGVIATMRRSRVGGVLKKKTVPVRYLVLLGPARQGIINCSLRISTAPSPQSSRARNHRDGTYSGPPTTLYIKGGGGGQPVNRIRNCSPICSLVSFFHL